MDSFVTTPSSSNIDLLIEKFKVEISRDVDEGSSGTRKLTLTSCITPIASERNDIDQQIVDLENLIKKLQGEITEMCENADKEKEYTPLVPDIRREFSNETIILDNTSDNVEESENVRDMREKDSNSGFVSDQYGNVYPVMVREVILPLDGGVKALGMTATKTLKTLSGEMVPDKIVTIQQDIINVWNDLPDYKPKDNLEALIGELQAEITETMENMKESNNEESSDKFEDA